MLAPARPAEADLTVTNPQGLRIKNWSHRSHTPRRSLAGSPQTPLPVRVRHPAAYSTSDPLRDGPETRLRQFRCITPAPFTGSHSLLARHNTSPVSRTDWRDRPNCQRKSAPRSADRSATVDAVGRSDLPVPRGPIAPAVHCIDFQPSDVSDDPSVVWHESL